LINFQILEKEMIVHSKNWSAVLTPITAQKQCLAQGPRIRKKRRFYFLFILARTTTKSIQFINKPVFLFWFFPYCCFGFISKAATTKNRQFIRSQYAMLGALASASVVSTLKSVCLSVKTTLRLSYRVLKLTLWVYFWYFWVWFN
jgi:hypothetical protein